MFSEDLSDFFDDDTGFAVKLKHKDREIKVLFDIPEEDVLGGEARSTQYRVTYPTNQIKDFVRGDIVEIDAKQFKVKEFRALEDGAVSQAILARV